MIHYVRLLNERLTMTIRKCDPEQAFRQYINKMDTVNQKPCRNASERFSKKFTQIGHNLMTVALSVILVAKDAMILVGVTLVTPIRWEILIVRILIPGAYQDWHQICVGKPTPFHQVARIVVDILGVGAAAIGAVTSLYKGSEWNVAMQKGLHHIPLQVMITNPPPGVPTPSPLKPPEALAPVPVQLNIANPPVQVPQLPVRLLAAPLPPPVFQQLVQPPAALAPRLIVPQPALAPAVQLPLLAGQTPVVLPPPSLQPPKPLVPVAPPVPKGKLPVNKQAQQIVSVRKQTAQLFANLPPPPHPLDPKVREALQRTAMGPLPSPPKHHRRQASLQIPFSPEPLKAKPSAIQPSAKSVAPPPPPPLPSRPLGQSSAQNPVPPGLSQAKPPGVSSTPPPPPPPPFTKLKPPTAQVPIEEDTDEENPKETNSLKPRRKITAHDLKNKRLRGTLPPGATPRKFRIKTRNEATGVNYLRARRLQIAPPSPPPSFKLAAPSSNHSVEPIAPAAPEQAPEVVAVNLDTKPNPLQLFADLKKGKQLKGTLAPGKTPRKFRLETRTKEDAGGFLKGSKLLDKFPPGSPSSPKTPTFKKREKNTQKNKEETPGRTKFAKLIQKNSPAKPSSPPWTP